MLPVIRLITLYLIIFHTSCGSDDYWDTDDTPIVIIFENDILGFDETILEMNEETRENAVDYERSKWPNGTVYYKLSDRFSCQQKCVIHEAMLEMEKKTCLNFIESPPHNHNGYIDIIKENRVCASYVGRQHNIQPLYLSNECAMITGNVMHELMHAIGFFHEHSRLDRDDFITVFFNNIESYNRKHFNNHNLGRVTTYNITYDYHSLMHYGPDYYSKNGEMTIKTKNEADQSKIGQRLALSEKDVKRINLHYKCSPRYYGCVDKDVDICKNVDMSAKCNQRKIRENVCHKSCGQCQLRQSNTNCQSCTDYETRCRKWSGQRSCPKISAEVRKRYYDDCENCF